MATTRRKRAASSTVTVLNLTCNYLTDPLGVETPRPRLSWELRSGERGQRQTAYRVLVASRREILDRDRGDRWDSGQVSSGRSAHVVYQGKTLGSRQGCFWKVQVWDRDGRPSGWSDPARWEMGLLQSGDWAAQWIGSPKCPYHPTDAQPAPLFRRELSLAKPVASARAYVSGLGYCELYINGRKIGDEALAPAFTRYDIATMYQTHDVSRAFRRGRNCVGVVLGNGWYNCTTKEVWDFQQAAWRHHPKLLLQVHLTFTDGAEQVIVSDPTWRCSSGPIVFDALRNGETYDARLERRGWTEPGYDDAEWVPARVAPGPGGVLRSQQMTPIRVVRTLKPVTVREVRSGVWVYDLGQNFAGWAQLIIQGPAGTTVTLKYAEKLREDGDIDQSNIDGFIKGGACQTDRYILSGQGIETWEPRFTYHGFRYVQVTGFPGTPTLNNLRGREVHTAFDDRGEFSCSNELLNAIQRCARWSTLSNYHGIPTDCPHREKNGWTGDAQLSAEQVLLNFNPMTAYHKWMADFRDIQRPSGQLPGIVPTGGWGFVWGSGPAWDSATVLIPWYLYLYCGDERILAEHYLCMKRYVDYITSMATDHTVEFGLGDWCPPVGGASDHACPTVVTDTAYYYVDALVLERVASLLGKAREAKQYRELAGKIRAAFRERFLDSRTGQVTTSSQTALSCALYQGLIDPAEQGKVLGALVASIEEKKRHLDCGILGAKYVMHALTDLGRADLAYAIATQKDFPSYGHWLAQGATTLWETWQGEVSRNHHMFSDISAWFYKGLAGINPDPKSPGFRHVILRPQPVGDLRWVRAWHHSLYGRVASSWSREGDRFTLEIEVPVSCTATVLLPTSDPASVKESNRPVSRQPCLKVGNWTPPRLAINAEAGQYRFSARLE